MLQSRPSLDLPEPPIAARVLDLRRFDREDHPLVLPKKGRMELGMGIKGMSVWGGMSGTNVRDISDEAPTLGWVKGR
jgi:hypothetical protein